MVKTRPCELFKTHLNLLFWPCHGCSSPVMQKVSVMLVTVSLLVEVCWVYLAWLLNIFGVYPLKYQHSGFPKCWWASLLWFTPGLSLAKEFLQPQGINVLGEVCVFILHVCSLPWDLSSFLCCSAAKPLFVGSFSYINSRVQSWHKERVQS